MSGRLPRFYILVAALAALTVAMVLDLLQFALGWAGITLFVGLFLPFELGETARNIRARIVAKNLLAPAPVEDQKAPQKCIDDIRLYSVASGGIVLAGWLVQLVFLIFGLNLESVGEAIGLVSIGVFVVAVFYVFRFADLERDWL